ncbi:uncharacterized protein LOC111675238 [Lucilia cuprina]|uniref:uncharacterized protein LOC111675238 n=1 Tax=Lucilia cuprina TaxID=7375 RepID=UPI001F060BF1|nr:uncharacterized protein LOC111675238 [Lucilia cuprina]XP_046802782.1 uncharacterized protein LOC111675238 [Lucilia cuprina]
MEAQQQTPAEVREVLNKYLELFQQNSIEFKYFLAPNSVIDWYGRTIRGANKIHDYLRHEIHNNFDHTEFLEPHKCAPIETKTSHMRTKIISTKPIDLVHPINRVPDMVPLKSYADSDVEDNELPETSEFAAAIINNQRKTPEKCTSTLIEDLTPPASATKEEKPNEEEKEVVQIEQATVEELNKPVRSLKRTHSGRFSYLRRLPTAPSTSKRVSKDYKGIRTLLDDSSSEDDDLETMEALYTPLRYIEVKGIMRNRSATTSRQRSALWRDCNQLETHLRISYRRKLEDNQLQFALIIYESCNPTPTITKRNLMTQFSMTEPNEDNDNVVTQIEPEYSEEMVVESVLHEPVLIEPHTVTTTGTLLGTTDDPFNEDEEGSLETLSVSHMRTPTKFTHTPPATPKRKPRSLFQSASGLKRLNNSPTAPTPKRSAARSLRL